MSPIFWKRRLFEVVCLGMYVVIHLIFIDELPKSKSNEHKKGRSPPIHFSIDIIKSIDVMKQKMAYILVTRF